MAQPFSATFWWISSLVSLPTLGKELEGAKRSTATSLGGDEILRNSDENKMISGDIRVGWNIERCQGGCSASSSSFYTIPTILITIILINITITIIIMMRKNTMRACSAGLERPLAGPLFCWHQQPGHVSTRISTYESFTWQNCGSIEKSVSAVFPLGEPPISIFGKSWAWPNHGGVLVEPFQKHKCDETHITLMEGDIHHLLRSKNFNQNKRFKIKCRIAEK